MRPLLASLLLLAACPRAPAPAAAPPPPAVKAEAPVAAAPTAPADDCTLETPLRPGVPGSPGHLIPSDINPNGASELATLMRRFIADWREARTLVEAGKPVPPRHPTHRTMRCAWPTAAGDRDATFDGLAQGYLAQVQAFDAAPSQASYDAVIRACAACHEVTCGGPLELIEGLRWPAAK